MENILPFVAYYFCQKIWVDEYFSQHRIQSNLVMMFGNLLEQRDPEKYKEKRKIVLFIYYRKK